MAKMLTRSCALVSLALLALLSFAGHRARHYAIGLQLYTVRDQCAKDFPGVLKSVGEMGYSGVEFAGYYGYKAEDLRKMLDQDHLKCYGSHIPLDDLLGDKFEQTVAFNKILGNKLIVIPWISADKRSTTEELLATAKQFSEIAQKLAPYGMTLAYHDHQDDFKIVDGKTVWEILFANADPKVAIQFDTGNAMEAGQQAKPYLTRFPGRVISVHVKDFSKTNSQALLGEGDENWADVIPLLKAKNGPRWLIIEQETYPYPSLVCAEKCLHTLQDMLARN